MNCLNLLAHCHRTGTRIRLHRVDSNANYNVRTRSDVQNVMDASLYERSPVRCVIKPEAMQELLQKVTTIKGEGEGEGESMCPITQSEFVEGDAVLVLPCGHAFIKDAIQTWLETESAECPVCRHALPSCDIITNK
jgi:hypothetical protein